MITPDRLNRLLQNDRLAVQALMAILFLLAALYTLFGVGMEMSALEMTARDALRDMPDMATAPDWSAGRWLVVIAMWWVMMAAMMLPGAAPAILLHAALTRADAASSAASFAFLGGYLVMWGLFSVMAASVQWALESTGLMSASMMSLTSGVLGGGILLAAGVYQLSPLKRACLAHCRGPADFLTTHRRPGITGALRMGREHAVFCLGCCWGLMALLFVGGVMNLYWIVGLTALVTLEKTTRIGSAIAQLSGIALAVWGVVLIIL
ncbi:MAG: DUF2182 domain-containing protein [Hoeflea sp.]|uniref:DUF2182 domain-containing protein n=1 Tax=Hoeflea sp. TaxID=1940281 RepID=UPI003EF139CB